MGSKHNFESGLDVSDTRCSCPQEFGCMSTSREDMEDKSQAFVEISEVSVDVKSMEKKT